MVLPRYDPSGFTQSAAAAVEPLIGHEPVLAVPIFTDDAKHSLMTMISKLEEAEAARIFYMDAEGTLRKNLISEALRSGLRPPVGALLGDSFRWLKVEDAAAVQLSFNSGRSSGWIDPAQNQRCLEDHEQDRHSQQQVGSLRQAVCGSFLE